MAIAPTLHTPTHGFSNRAGLVTTPNFEAAAFAMAHILTLSAGEHVACLAFTGLVSDLVALEAELFVAFEAVVAIFSAEDTI
jgi:hypothetical protein